MKRLIWHWIISSLALYLTVLLLHSGVQIEPMANVLWLAPLLGLVNMLVGGLARLLSLIAFPVNLLTLGCFGFLLSFIGYIVAIMLLSNNLEVFNVSSFWWAVALSIVMALFSSLLNMLLPGKDQRRR